MENTQLSTKINSVRYADDFIVTAKTKEIAEEAKELIRQFLKDKGLELSEEKTLITHIDNGFDFLGWNFRKYNGTLLVKPSKKSIDKVTVNISNTIKRGKAWKQEELIAALNPLLQDGQPIIKLLYPVKYSINSTTESGTR